MATVKKLLLKFPITREIAFFIFQKKVYKRQVDKKINELLKGHYKLADKKVNNLIVSLTSFPERINEIKYVVYSILDQSVLPQKIILWLAASQFPLKEKDLPAELLSFKNYGLDIRWCDDLRSYKKLIPALENFPDYFILTADDDLYYKKKWVEKIWNEHIEHPDELVCHIINKIRFDKDGHVLPYQEWYYNVISDESSFINFPLCGGGALFHKSFLFKDITNKDLFSNLSPYADDIWFYFMTILGNTPIRIVKKPYNKVKYINPYREYDLNNQFKLAAVNIGDSQNDEQFKKVLTYYNIDLKSLCKESR